MQKEGAREPGPDGWFGQAYSLRDLYELFLVHVLLPPFSSPES